MLRMIQSIALCAFASCSAGPPPRSAAEEPWPAEPAGEEPVEGVAVEEPSDVGEGQVSIVDASGDRVTVAADADLEVLAIVDRAMREHGDLGVYGDLRGGLRWAVEHFTAEIRDGEERIGVGLGPRSGEGHDFGFEVIRATGELVDAIIGEVEPMPEDLE